MMIAVSPVIAVTQVTTSVQNTAYATITPQSFISHSNGFSPSAYVSTQGRFAGSTNPLVPVRPVSSNTRFSAFVMTITEKSSLFTESDNGKYVNMTKGQEFQVKLDENPTTGYMWVPTVSDGIRIIGDIYTPSSSGRMGAGGVHTWTLKVTGSGDQYFNAEYKRSWEPGSIDNYSINIIVA